MLYFFFFFNDTATTEIYTLSLHDALPISRRHRAGRCARPHRRRRLSGLRRGQRGRRSEEHTSELQSPCNLVCRLLLEKKKKSSNGSDYEFASKLVRDSTESGRFECLRDRL